MDQHMIKLNEIKIEKATKALESNNYNVKVVDTLLDAKAYVQSLLVDHKKVGLGGSMTLEAMNIVEMCRNSDIDFIVTKGDMQTLFQYISFVNKLEDVFNCHVDVVSTEIEDQNFLTNINKESVLLYDR